MMNSISSLRSYLNKNHENVRKVLGALTCIFQIAGLTLSSKTKVDSAGNTLILVGAIFAVLLLLHSKSLKEAVINVFFIVFPLPLYLFLLVSLVSLVGLLASGLNLKSIYHLGTALMTFVQVFGMVMYVIWPFILFILAIKLGIFAFNRKKLKLI